MTAIIDYGVGNLFSLCSSFSFIGEDAVITNDVSVIRKSDRLVLPGVGAFKDAADKLRESGMAEVVRAEAASGKPLLGICSACSFCSTKASSTASMKGWG